MTEVLVETAFKGVLGTCTLIYDIVKGCDSKPITDLYKFLNELEPIIKELEQNYVGDELVNKQIQSLWVTYSKIQKFIKKVNARNGFEKRIHSASETFRKTFGLETEENEIKTFYNIVSETKKSILYFLKSKSTQSSVMLNTQMDEMLDLLKHNISSEDSKRLDTVLEEKEKVFRFIIDNQTKQIEDLKRFIVEKDNQYTSLLMEKDEAYKEQIGYMHQEILGLRESVLFLQTKMSEHTILLSKHTSDIENLKNESRHRLDMVEMERYESLLKEKLDLEDIIKTLQKEKLDMNDKYKSLESTHRQCKFDEEVFKNLERSYHKLTAKFTQIEMDYKALETEHIVCKEQIILKQNLNMVLSEEKLPEYIEEIPFGTQFIYSHINHFSSSFNVIKNINSCGYIHFMKYKIIFPIKDEYKSGDKKYISSDKKIHIYPNEFSLWDEHNRVIISHSYVCYDSSRDSKYFRVNHPALDYQTICKGEKTYITSVLHMFMYPYSKVDTLDTKRRIFYETEYPNKDDTILKFINVRDKYRSIKIFYLLNLDVNIEFGYFYIIGEDTEVRISKCVDKNVYVEESDYPLCKFKAGEFIEFVSDKNGLLEMRFDISLKQLVFYENEKVVGMKMIKDNSYYFVKYY